MFARKQTPGGIEEARLYSVGIARYIEMLSFRSYGRAFYKRHTHTHTGAGVHEDDQKSTVRVCVRTARRRAYTRPKILHVFLWFICFFLEGYSSVPNTSARICVCLPVY